MRYLILTPLLIACSNNHKTTWTNPHLEACVPRLATTKPLPFSIALNLNRIDASRYDSFYSTRAYTISKDLEIKDISSELLDKNFDGQIGVFVQYASEEQINVVRMWENPNHALDEERQGNFNFVDKYYRWDIYSVKGNEFKNLTKDSISFYNNGGGVFDNKITYTSIVNNTSVQFKMDLDGANKVQLTTTGFVYGYSESKDKRHFAYHSDYKLYIDGKKVNTPCSFNFGPKWAPDSSKLAFICDGKYFQATADGTEVKPLGSRDGLSETVPFMLGYDFHHGGTDRFVWTSDSKYLVHSKKVNGKAALVLSNDQDVQVLTQDLDVSHPIVKDNYILFHAINSNNKMYDVYILDLTIKEITQVTDLDANCNSRYALPF